MKTVWFLALGLVGAGAAVGCSRPAPAVQPGVSITAEKPAEAVAPAKAEAACAVQVKADEDGEKGEEGEEGEECEECAQETVALDQLPAGVRDAAMATAPGFAALKAVKLTAKGKSGFILIGKIGDKPAAVHIGADGKAQQLQVRGEEDEDGEEGEDEEGEEHEEAGKAKGKD